jgi:hypothetical protein
MVASELVDDIERRMHKGPFSAALVSMYVSQTWSEGLLSDLIYQRAAMGRMQMRRERSIGARTN